MINFAARATREVNAFIYHCDFAVSPSQSWLLWLMGSINPTYRSEYWREGMLAIERMRCGLCHQAAYVLAELMAREGAATARVIGLSGHVVTYFEIAGHAYLSDADVGVGPFPIDWSDPQSIERQVVQNYGPAVTPEFLQLLVRIYANTADDDWYSTMDDLGRLAAEQRLVLLYQEAFEKGLMLCATLALAAALAAFRRLPSAPLDCHG